MTRKKIIIFTLLGLCAIEGFLVYKLWSPEKNIMPLHFFSFHDSLQSYVAAEGTWLSDVAVYNPVQTSKIECWKDRMICVEALAYISERYLAVDTYYYDIDTWNDKEIKTKIDESAECTAYIMRLDRIQKQVTKTRTKMETNNSACNTIDDKPIHQYLADGIESKKGR